MNTKFMLATISVNSFYLHELGNIGEKLHTHEYSISGALYDSEEQP